MMITTQHYLDLLGHEFTIIRHLASKLKESDLEYRPTENQRTLLELLQYMSYVFETTAKILVTGDMTIWADNAKAATMLTLADFDAVMGSQEWNLHNLFKQLSAEQLKEEVDLWGVRPRSIHFMNIMKWATSYKMQLFLYMKSLGYNLNSMNLWVGVDEGVM